MESECGKGEKGEKAHRATRRGRDYSTETFEKGEREAEGQSAR